MGSGKHVHRMLLVRSLFPQQGEGAGAGYCRRADEAGSPSAADVKLCKGVEANLSLFLPHIRKRHRRDGSKQLCPRAPVRTASSERERTNRHHLAALRLPLRN